MYRGFPEYERCFGFSFDSRDDNGKSLPDDFEKNNVVYTGTHDSDTVLGWYTTALIKRRWLNSYALSWSKG
ncbi:MAG: 4-alpha-glucanotransferase [Eubacterium sp.]